MLQGCLLVQQQRLRLALIKNPPRVIDRGLGQVPGPLILDSSQCGSSWDAGRLIKKGYLYAIGSYRPPKS
ncbi:hypothetical protein VTN31DRAFT_6215 [Thermomyces dupontii]|uniref:uncharacterized protein n=1 Tax=Talaromyces thermophilus TaxID=28565 RepID=UPI003743EA65